MVHEAAGKQQQKRKHSPITLHVAEWNQNALRLYLNNDFVITESEIIQR